MSAVMAIEFEDQPKISFVRLMRELSERGWTAYRVAMTICADHATAYSWARGSEPRHSYGVALINLHRAVCGDEASEKLRTNSQ